MAEDRDLCCFLLRGRHSASVSFMVGAKEGGPTSEYSDVESSLRLVSPTMSLPAAWASRSAQHTLTFVTVSASD
jgi:hypothetical protein